MRLKSLALKNFRCFTDEKIEFDSYTALVGANNAGKSAVVAALDIFFRSNPKNIPITIDDFFKKEAHRQLEITLTFTDLTEPALKEFSHYVRSDELTFFIKSVVENAMVRSSLHGIRLANPDFAPFFEKVSAASKKEFYEDLQKSHELPKWQNQNQARDILRNLENSIKYQKQNIPIPSEDDAFGVEGPVPRLRQFIDFVCIPAVKDAGDEAIEARNTAFSRLIDRAVRAKLKVEQRVDKIREEARNEIDAIARDHQEILTNLAEKIEQEYRKFNSTESRLHLDWGSFDAKNLQINLPAVHLQVSDDLIRNVIGKFGHGTQRNYIMALLMVSASYDFTSFQTIIIACEEPELYQHPPQARILANALYALASNQAQIILTTHSPHFITAKSFEKIRVIRRSHGQRSKSYQWSIDENCSMIAKAKGEAPIGVAAARAAINQFLQPEINEMFFAPGIIFVEGEEDRAIISKYFHLCGKHSEFLAKGLHIVPTSGKGNLINAISIARGFEIPIFAVFDGDMNLEAKKLPAAVKLNREILSLLAFDGQGKDGSITDHLWGTNFCIWKESIQNSIGDKAAWQSEIVKLAEEFGWTIARLHKNPMVLEGALENIHKKGPIPHLEKLCSAILAAF